MPSFLMIQWGIIGFFVLIHFLIGLLRGTSKSTYYTIVSILMTIVTLWLVSKLSLNLIISSTGGGLESLVRLINGFIGGTIPEDVIIYLQEPEVAGFTIAMIDLVIRIIGFLIIYPILKFSLTTIIFRPFWKHLILPKLIEKQNDKLFIEHNRYSNSKKKFVPNRRLHKNVFSRLFGGVVGSFRGLIVAFVFLVPLLVVSGFASELQTNVNIYAEGQRQDLSAGQELANVIPSEIEDILKNIEEMNKGGLSAIVKNIKIQNKVVDRYIFDKVFTTYIVSGEEKTEVNFGNELEQFVGIGSTILKGGYLDNFDVDDISDQDLNNLETVLNHIGQSKLISYMIPVGTRIGVEKFAPEYLNGIKLHERAASKKALDEFYVIDWDQEFNRIYQVAEAMLTFGSVSELKLYIEHPELLAELTPEQGLLLANVFRTLGDLETLTLINVAIDYATTLEEVQKQISWLEPNEIEEYLQEKLMFVLDKPDFFTGSNGDIYKIAKIVETIFTDDFGDSNLSILVNSFNDPQAFIDNQNPDWVGEILKNLVDVQLLINSIPVGVDYAFYTQLRESIDENLAEQITTKLETIEWDNEIINVGDIYKEALKLGVGAVFGNNPDYYAFIDQVAVNHMASLRTIVEYVFEGSDVVNTAIELASPAIVDLLVKDEALKDIIYDVLMSDPSLEIVDFEFGKEVNSLLTIVESVFKFTTASELSSLKGLGTNELLEVVSHFGMLSESEYESLRTAIYDLQILSRAGHSGLAYAKSQIDTPYLYVPDTVELNKDIAVLLDITYEVANYIQNENPLGLDYQDIEFTNLLASEDFRAYFLDTAAQKNSQLISLNIAHNIKYFSEQDNFKEYLTLPADLSLLDIDAPAWKLEVNALLGSIFDLATSVGQTDQIKLSVKGIIDVTKDPKNLSVEAFTQFSDPAIAERTFGSLDSSRILRNSLVKTIDKLGATFEEKLYGYKLAVPGHLIEDDMLIEGALTNLIYSIAVLAEDMNKHLDFETFNDAMSFKDTYAYIDAFNKVDDLSLQIFGSADLIHGIVSEVFLNPDLQQVGRDLINDKAPLGISVDNDFLNLTRVNGVLGTFEFSDLLIGIKAAQLTSDLLKNFKVEMFSYAQTLDQETLDLLFDPYLLRELIDQLIANDGVVDNLVNLAQEQYDKIQTSQKILAGVNPNIGHMISSLPNLKDADGFFDTNEIKSWILAFKELDVSSMEELKGLGNLQNIHEKVATSFAVETLMKSKWMYGLVNDVFTLESTLEQIAALATDQVYKQTGISHTFTTDEVSFIAAKYGIIETVGPQTGHVKISELKNFILAGTRLNWPKLGLGTGTTLVSNLANELMSTGFDGQRHIDVVFNSKLLIGILDKAMNFEYNTYASDEIVVGFINKKIETIAALNGLQLTADILHYDLSAYDANQVIRKEEFIEMVEAVTYIDFSQKIGIDTFYQMTVNDTFKELFDSKIIHSLVSNALTNQVVQEFGVDKANGAQSIISLSDNILAVDPELMNGDLFKVTELENILIAMHTLGLTSSQGFNSIGIPTFTNLLGSNVDVNGDDDFDRVFKANYIYVLLDRILKLESLGDYVGLTLGDAMGISITNFDTSPSSAMLGDGSASFETIENGRIPKDEFRAMITSLDLLGDLKAIGIKTFTDMVDRNVAEDDFTIFIDSNYIYTIIARLFDHPAFGNYVGEMLADAFADDPITLDMKTPEDALGVTGVEEDLMTRVELRQMMISFDMLGLDGSTNISVTTIMDMIDLNATPIREDEFSVFIESLYIQDKISQLLLSKQVVETIASSRYTYSEFSMPAVSLKTVGTRERLIKNEIYDVFFGLKLIGLTDFENVDITLADITSLTDPQQDRLLDSSYLYVVLDLMLKSETTLNIPSDALETSGDFDEMVMKTEIKSLLAAFDLLGESDPANINAELITIKTIRDMLDLDSAIIDQLISDAMEDNLTSVPTSAYDSHLRISRDELYKMVDTLVILGGGDDQQTIDALMPIDTDTVTTQVLQDINDVDSRIVDRLISEAIIDSGISIHSLAYDPLSEEDEFGNKLDIKRSELQAMLDASDILGIDLDEANTFDKTKLTPSNLHLLMDLNSQLMNRLISEDIMKQSLETASSLAVDGDSNYDPLAVGSDIKVAEIRALIEAMIVIDVNNTTEPIHASGVDVVKLEKLHYLGLGIDPNGDVYQSTIIHRMISNAVITTLTVPTEAYMLGSTLDIKSTEIDHILVSMDILGVTDVASVQTEITINKLKNDLSPANVEILVKHPIVDPNFIVYAMISDVIDPTNNLYDFTLEPNPDDFYELDPITNARVRLKRDSITDAISRIP